MSQIVVFLGRMAGALVEKVGRVAVPAVNVEPTEQPGSGGFLRALPLHPAVWKTVATIGSGFAVYAVSPPRDLWWLVPVALVPFFLVVRGQRARVGFGYGLIFGLAFLLPLVGWLRDFLGAQFGPWPWLGVGLVEALFFGLAGAGIARVSRLPAAPVWAAAVYLAAELARSSVPFGGFPWGRLAFTQSEGVLLPLASVGGAALVTFAVALMGAALAELIVRLWARSFRAATVPVVLVSVPVLAGIAVLPTLSAQPDSGTAKVGLVQGNAPNIGLDLLSEDDVLHDNHVQGVRRLADEVRAGEKPRPDVVVLPEQVGSWGPDRRDPELAGAISELGVPALVGGLAQDSQDRLSNRVLQWAPDGDVTAEYTKQHLVPFSETIPMRSVARLVTPFVDRFQQDMLPGDEPGVFDVGTARVGVGLCFDVAYDDVFTGAVRQGATLLAVPTNNAWFGQSEMSYQQLAMSRLRAVEHGRAVAVAATSGVSAVVQPDGTVNDRTELFTANNIVAEVPLRSQLTLATRLGSWPGWILAAGGLMAVAATFAGRGFQREASRGIGGVRG